MIKTVNRDTTDSNRFNCNCNRQYIDQSQKKTSLRIIGIEVSRTIKRSMMEEKNTKESGRQSNLTKYEAKDKVWRLQTKDKEKRLRNN